MAVDIKAFSKVVGVSTATVSRAFSGRGRISEKTRERILDEAKRIGFTPNIHARRLNLKRTEQIGLYYTFSDDPIFDYYNMELAQEIAKAAERRGYAVHLELGKAEKGREEERLRELTSGAGLDGVILVVDGRSSGMRLLRAVQRCPVVIIAGFSWPPVEDEIVVELNVVNGISEAIAELVRLGHQKIGFIGGPGNKVKFNAYSAALKANGVKLRQNLVEEGLLTFADGQKALRRIASHRPTAVLCATDILALGTLNEAQKLGLQVPSDLSIIGMDDLAFTAYTTPALSTIRIPREPIASTAVERLLARLEEGAENGRYAPSSHVISSYFVPRNSISRCQSSLNANN